LPADEKAYAHWGGKRKRTYKRRAGLQGGGDAGSYRDANSSLGKRRDSGGEGAIRRGETAPKPAGATDSLEIRVCGGRAAAVSEGKPTTGNRELTFIINHRKRSPKGLEKEMNLARAERGRERGGEVVFDLA